MNDSSPSRMKMSMNFMHCESLDDFLILLELWIVGNSVDTGVAVVQVMVACEPSPCVVAASEWHFGYAPFHILWRQSLLCCARLGGLMLALPKHYGHCRSVLERPSVCLWSASFDHLKNVFLHRVPRKGAVLGGAHQAFELHVQPT